VLLRLHLIVIIFLVRRLLSFHDKRPLRVADFPSRVAAIPTKREITPRKVVHAQMEELESHRTLGRTVMACGGAWQGI
jgi:hypothetical protein